jgi:hypothetical protein
LHSELLEDASTAKRKKIGAMQRLKEFYWLALTVGNILLLIVAGVGLAAHMPPTRQFYYLLLAVTVMNLFYIGRTFPRTQRKSRIGTLVNLWFDAKERELRERGNPQQ